MHYIPGVIQQDLQAENDRCLNLFNEYTEKLLSLCQESNVSPVLEESILNLSNIYKQNLQR